jgi:hypothetical protein
VEWGENGSERHIDPHIDRPEGVLNLCGCGVDLVIVRDVGGMVKALPPAFSTSLAAPSRPACPRASSATCAPRAPNCRAVARAIPALAPVITTT